MNIYLTSYGVDTRYKDYMNSYQDIIDVLKGKKVAIIPNAKLINQDRTNSTIAKEELTKNKIESDIIDLDTDKFDINNYDALYLSGGEPEYLMDSIINAGLYDDIKRFIDNGGIVIGQSAGAMIFNKEYYIHLFNIDLLDIKNNGYDYADKMIVPHYDHAPIEIKEKIPQDVIKINDKDRLIKL